MVATSTILKITPFQWNPSFPYKQHPYVHFYSSKPQLRSNSLRLQNAVKYKQSPYFEAQALAASGGRTGGSAFSSRSNTSSSSTPSSQSPSSSASRYSSRTSKKKIIGIIFKLLDSARPIIDYWSLSLIVAATFVFYFVFKINSNQSQNDILTNSPKTSVLRLQVGLLGSARTLQQDFYHLAETAGTSTPKGLIYLLTEATLALLRHPNYCISCYSSVDVKQCVEEGEKQFNQLFVKERGKFDEETLINVNNIKIRNSKIHRDSGLSNEYIFVVHDILVAVEGTLKLQTIKGTGDLKEALHKLRSIRESKTKMLQALEVLWTPQKKDVLTEIELLEDYPLLRPF
ncbi:uncharacterized protein LOC17894540 [Capsella rubella]|uniref:uncharacterized protein LOC17894540 n=1 Tax=Capsella rubella TaxID=81985 RepID=UPI000CD4E2CF|nr:uncharacterized protein LOC17894540 [Capsella rubella]